MNWKIIDSNGSVINTIFADENFVVEYCKTNSYTYEKLPDSYIEPNYIEARANKLAEITKSCEAYIYAGTNVTLPDNTVEHFTYTLADQSNISEMFTAIMAGATEYPYHADGEICKIYSKEQIITIYGTLSLFKTEATTYHNSLKAQINAMTDVDAINAVKFEETPLEGEYLDNYTAMMASAQTQLNAVLARIPSVEVTI